MLIIAGKTAVSKNKRSSGGFLKSINPQTFILAGRISEECTDGAMGCAGPQTNTSVSEMKGRAMEGIWEEGNAASCNGRHGLAHVQMPMCMVEWDSFG